MTVTTEIIGYTATVVVAVATSTPVVAALASTLVTNVLYKVGYSLCKQTLTVAVPYVVKKTVSKCRTSKVI